MAAKKKQSNRKINRQLAETKDALTVGGGSRLSGKIAVVTGGNRGIGMAIARALVREGCSVVITGRDRVALMAAKTELSGVASGCDAVPDVLAENCDVRHEASVSALFAKVKEKWGGLDILVNNAGVSQATVPVEKTPLAVWNAAIDTNLTGTFLCSRAAIPLMRRGATIVNTLSIAAKMNLVNFAAYNASKHGALGFTLTLREELIPKGIRVMALLPGATATDIWKQFWPEAPREKMVEPENVAQAVLYAVLLPPQVNLSQLELVPLEGVL
ncbi:MAG TPA: SDR family oxidoreductase [Candidatus Eisenbacteria bacterium]|nr:SDR family oxidoreductase [Candidatus Eisenbacteria bacterium]